MGLSNHGLCGSLLMTFDIILAQLRLKAGQWARHYITSKTVSFVPITAILRAGRAPVYRPFRHLWLVQTQLVFCGCQLDWLARSLKYKAANTGHRV